MLINASVEMLAVSSLTDNEINNLIYALLKYGYGKIVPNIKDPPNSLIKDIMMEVYEEGTNIPSVINSTMRIVEDRYNVFLSDRDFERLKQYFYKISVAVMQQPFEVRDDLGSDAESDDFITKH